MKIEALGISCAKYVVLEKTLLHDLLPSHHGKVCINFEKEN